MLCFADNLRKCQDYIKALEEERVKIQVFKRELPLCLELVTQAIEAYKQQLSGAATTECLNGHSECSEQTSSDGPVLEQFIPLKGTNSTINHDDVDDDDDDEHESIKGDINNDKSGKKSDWLRSVQLWNQTPDPPTSEEPKRVSVVEVKSNGGAFHPFQKEKGNGNGVNKSTTTPAASSCSSAKATAGGCVGGSNGGGGKEEEKGGQSQRKSRRCWSPELHKRFLHALQQLGGSHVATPKQIREFMKVDGLTNDEVKSHLQKYRLHTRRPSSGAHNTTNSQASQFVVVGGIWMPSAEYAAVAAAATTSGDASMVSAPNGIYAPVAAMAALASQPQVSNQRPQQKQSSQSHCEESSNSPATSSSTHTTTGCHGY